MLFHDYLGVTHKYKNQKKSEISDFSGPPPLYRKVRTQNQRSFIAFLDTMSYDWDFKIILYFSPLKSGKDLEYFWRVLPRSPLKFF